METNKVAKTYWLFCSHSNNNIGSVLLVFAPMQPPVINTVKKVTDDTVAIVTQISDKSYPLSLTNNSSVKPYMGYRAITDTTSKQYALLQTAYSDCNGLIIINGYYAVAMGKWFGEVGSKYKVTFDDGKEIYIIKADEKQTAHTYENNDMYGLNGHVLEMLVDTNKLDNTARFMGNCDYIEAITGTITKIERID